MENNNRPLLNELEKKNPRSNWMTIGGVLTQTLFDMVLVTCEAVKDELEDELKIHRNRREARS